MRTVRAALSNAVVVTLGIVILVGLAAPLVAQERIYYQLLAPSVLRAASFDGSNFAVEDPTPGSAGSAEFTSFAGFGFAVTDRWFAVGYQGTGISMGLMDPQSGVQPPIVQNQVGAAGRLVASATGEFAIGVGESLLVYDLRPSSATFRQVVATLPVSSSETLYDIAVNPARTRLYLASGPLPFVNTAATTVRVFDISSPAAPSLLDTDAIPVPATNFQGNFARVQYVTVGGVDYLAIGRSFLHLVPIDGGGLLDVANRIDWFGSGAYTRYRIMGLHAADTPSGPRLFLGTTQYTDDFGHALKQILVFDLTLPIPGGWSPLHAVDLIAPGAASESGGPLLEPSLDGSYLFTFEPGGIFEKPEPDDCKLRAFDLDALAAGVVGQLDELDLDAGAPVEVCGGLANSFVVAAAPPAPPSGPIINDIVVDGAVPDDILVNDVPRSLTISGSGLDDVAFAYLGEVELAIDSVSSTVVEVTVPALAPSGNPKLVLLDANGAMAIKEGLIVNNPPQFLPGSRVYASSFTRNQVVEINGATANAVIDTFDSGMGIGRGVATPDGRFLLVGGFRDSRAHIHALVADPDNGYDWNERIAAPYNSFVREIEISPDGTRAYLNAGSCWVGVVDLTTVPPSLVDTDADPGTTDFPSFVGDEPEQAGITRIPLGADVAAGDCLPFSNSSAMAPSGDWLYLSLQSAPNLVAIRLGAHADPDVVDGGTDVFQIPVAGVPNGRRADGIAVHPDGSTLYFASSGETTLHVLSINPGDGADLTEVGPPVAIPGAALLDVRTMELRPDGKYLYVAARGAGTVDVFDTTTPTAPAHVTTIPVGKFAETPFPSRDNQWLYVAAAGSDLVAILDVRDGSPTQHTVLTTSGSGKYVGNAFASPGLETPTGTNVEIQPAEDTTIAFSQVSAGGNTTVTSSNVTNVAVPPDFQVDLGGAPVFYDVQTDVAFSGPVEVCFSYSEGVVADESSIRLLHEVAGTFEDVTTSLDTVNNKVCGVVTSFSQFAIGEHVGAIIVDPPSPNVIAEPFGVVPVTVRARVAPTGTVYVPVSLEGECIEVPPYASYELDAGNYLVGFQINVAVIDDGDPEAQELCRVVTLPAGASDSQPEFDGVDGPDVSILIVDDDSTDLAIAKSDGLDEVAPGANLTYTITLTNRLDVAVVGAEFEDVLPAAVAYTGSSCSGGDACSIGESGGTVTGTADLDAGASATFLIHVTVDSGASGTISNTAAITGFGGVADLDTGNDSATDETRVADVDPPAVSNVNSFADTGDGVLAQNEATELPITELSVTFDETVRSSDAGNSSRYLLYRGGSNVLFDTVDCSGVAAGDELVSVDSASYSDPTATLQVNGGGALPDGLYQLRVCGSIRDLEGNGLAGGDFLRTFVVDTAPPTVENVDSTDGTGGGSLSNGEATDASISQIHVRFSEPMNPTLAASAANFMLLEANGDTTVEAVDCATGAHPSDFVVVPSGVVYDVPTRTSTLDFAAPLGEGVYKLFVCGSTSVEDLAGRKLDGNYDSTAGDDFVTEFWVDQTPPELPASVTSSHDGGAAPPPILVEWWGGTSDALTGVAGFAWEFSTSPSGSCDETVDGTDEAASSGFVAPDDWYFHLCAVDFAGNWSGVATFGPWTTLPVVPVKKAGPWRITVPSGFDLLPAFGLKDQNLAQNGVQIDVSIYQTGSTVQFLTDDVVPAGLASIGESLAGDEHGTAQGGFLQQGRVYAYGFRPGQGQAMWTPAFNGDPDKGVHVGGNAGVGDDSCGMLTLPSNFGVPGVTFVDQDGGAPGRQVRAYTTQGGGPTRPLQVFVRTDDAYFTAGGPGSPATGIVLSRTGAASSDGRLDGRCFNVGGRALVTGLLPTDTRRVWTPKFNNGQASAMDYADTGAKFPVDPHRVAGVLGYWRGRAADGGADLAGPNEGDVYNGAGYAPGRIGEAFSFGGEATNHVFEAPSAGLDGLAEFTVSLWVRAADTSLRYQALAGQGQGSLNYGLEIASTGGALGLDLGAQTDAEPLTFVSEANGGDGFPFAADVWVHVAGVYDGSELRLYVDGEPAPGYDPQPLTGTVSSVGGYWSIGATPGTDDNELGGLIDDVAVFSRALSPAEIQGLYQRRVGGI